MTNGYVVVVRRADGALVGQVELASGHGLPTAGLLGFRLVEMIRKDQRLPRRRGRLGLWQ